MSRSEPVTPPPKVTVFYHYFHPDDVVSARHFSDLCEGLAKRGWEVVAKPCNRGCRDESITYPKWEEWAGVKIHRLWRPNFKQSSGKGRLLNAFFMILRWSIASRHVSRHRREVMIVGTDPVLSVLVARFWKLIKPSCKIVHWCFDLYPEAPIAEGMFQENSRLIRLVRGSLKKAYKACDLIADLGPCMAQLLSRYQSQAKTTTLVPWALVEPNEPVTVDPNTRKELFGEAQLALLYSGSYGRAHSCAEFLELARHLKPNTDIQFNFAARGNRIEELKSQVTSDDSNVHFAGFAPESQLEKRLGSCDIHMVSLRPEWTGTVVPSKFFGALATGRSVLFSGSPNSAIAKWIEEFKVGWVLSKENIKEVADQLNRLASSPEQLLQMNRHCHQIYQTHFSKDHLLNRWDQELRELL